MDVTPSSSGEQSHGGKPVAMAVREDTAIVIEPAPVAAQSATSLHITQLESEKIVVAAPLSFAGSAARIWKLSRMRSDPGPQAALTILAVLLIAVAWSFVLVWYATWGILLVPYRLIRRGSRNRKRDALQHRETLAAINRQ